MNSMTPEKAVFEPFHWLVEFDHTQADTLVETTQDVARGLQITLQMIEHSELADEEGDAPILDNTTRYALLRFAITTAQLLADTAAKRISDVNDKRIGREWIPHGPR